MEELPQMDVTCKFEELFGVHSPFEELYAPISQSGTSLNRIRPEEKFYHCPHCELKYKSRRGFTYHLSREHSESETDNYYCPHCGVKYKSIPGLNYHLSHAHSESDISNYAYQCPHCGVKYKSKPGLNYHLSHAHSESEISNYAYHCPHCGAKYKSKPGLNYHLSHAHSESEISNYAYHCPHCEVKYKSMSGLNYHLSQAHSVSESETDNYAYHCPHCGVKYKSIPGLNYHLSHAHSESETSNFYHCPHCGVKYKSIPGLKYHLSHAHSESKPNSYHCPHPQCGVKYKSRTGLTYHLSHAHSESKTNSFHCPQCGVKYKSRSGLTYHLSHAHSESETGNCSGIASNTDLHSFNNNGNSATDQGTNNHCNISDRLDIARLYTATTQGNVPSRYANEYGTPHNSISTNAQPPPVMSPCPPGLPYYGPPGPGFFYGTDVPVSPVRHPMMWTRSPVQMGQPQPFDQLPGGGPTIVLQPQTATIDEPQDSSDITLIIPFRKPKSPEPETPISASSYLFKASRKNKKSTTFKTLKNLNDTDNDRSRKRKRSGREVGSYKTEEDLESSSKETITPPTDIDRQTSGKTQSGVRDGGGFIIGPNLFHCSWCSMECDDMASAIIHGINCVKGQRQRSKNILEIKWKLFPLEVEKTSKLHLNFKKKTKLAFCN